MVGESGYERNKSQRVERGEYNGGQLRLLGEVVAKVNNFDGLGEVVVLTWKLLGIKGSV